MRFLMMYTPATNAGGPPSPEHMAEMGRLIDESKKAGELLATGGLKAGAQRVESAGGKLTVIDGPFAETKEVIAGFALVQATSKEAAIEMAKRFLKVAGDGVSEIHQVFEEHECAA